MLCFLIIIISRGIKRRISRIPAPEDVQKMNPVFRNESETFACFYLETEHSLLKIFREITWRTEVYLLLRLLLVMQDCIYEYVAVQIS